MNRRDFEAMWRETHKPNPSRDYAWGLVCIGLFILLAALYG
jgi:hypothetical protein